VVPLANGRYPRYYAGMLRAMRGEAEAPVTARQALAVQRVLDAAERVRGGRCDTGLKLDSGVRPGRLHDVELG